MTFHSTDQREGEPTLVLVNCRLRDGIITAGLAFARSGLQPGRYEITPAGKPGESWYIQLNPDAVGLKRDGWAANVPMEVVSEPQPTEKAAATE